MYRPYKSLRSISIPLHERVTFRHFRRTEIARVVRANKINNSNGFDLKISSTASCTTGLFPERFCFDLFLDTASGLYFICTHAIYRFGNWWKFQSQDRCWLIRSKWKLRRVLCKANVNNNNIQTYRIRRHPKLRVLFLFIKIITYVVYTCFTMYVLKTHN